MTKIYRIAGAVLVAMSLSAGCGTRVGNNNATAARATTSGTAPDPDAPVTTGTTPVVSDPGATAGPSGAGPAGPVAAADGPSNGRAEAGPTRSGAATAPPRSAASSGATHGGADRGSPAAPDQPGKRPDAASAAAPAPGPPPPAPVPAGSSPVIIGSVGTYSGPAASSLKPVLDATAAWAKFVTDRGGLNGHPVKLISADDAGDPARHRALVQQLVEQKKVIAFVGNGEALTGGGSVDYLEKVRVPTIPGDGGENWAYDSTMYFPPGPTGDVNLQATMSSIFSRAVAAGKKKVGTLVCIEAQACRDGARSAPSVARAQKAEIVYQGQSSLAQPDFTSECLAARNAGVETLAIFMDANSVARVAASCVRQGFKPVFATGGAIVAPFLKDDPNLDGALVGMNMSPWTLSNTPGRAEFQQAMGIYLKGADIGAGHMFGWTSGKLLQAAARELPEPPTSAAVLEGLWRLHDDDLGGLTQPLTFERDKPPDPRMCWYNVTIASGRFTSPDDGKRYCGAYQPL